MPRYLWLNVDTDEVVEIDRPLKDSNVPPDEPGTWIKPIVMPGFTRKTYLDGMRSKSDKGYAALKQSSQLEVERANSTDTQQRKEIDRAIDRLTKV